MQPIRDALLSTLPLAAMVTLIVAGATHVAGLAEQQRLTRLNYAPPPVGMVFVPAGEFLVGSSSAVADADEFPLRRAFTRAFYIDIYEVTNAEFNRFDSSHEFTPERANWPVTGISKEAAQAYAESLGKRLPTAAEWEKAARGSNGQTYPWGEEYRDGLANIGADEMMPVGSFRGGASPYGVHDMAGNAWEWTSDVFRDKPSIGANAIERNVIKGGGYSYSPFQARASYQGFESIGGTCNDLGFRCAMDAVPLE